MLIQDHRFREKLESKMHSNKRALIVKVKEGEKARSTAGLVDSRLFTGQNKLFALKEPVGNLWMLRYESGMIPPVLRQKFTKFSNLLDHTQRYFSKRGLEITEVIDDHGQIQ